MFRGFRFQVVLPVATVALLLVSLGAVAFSLWATHREELAVRQQVADNVTAIQAAFVTTEMLMEERTHAGMNLLKDQISSHGGAEKGPPVTVTDKTVNDIIVGGKGQAGNFEFVDYVTRMMKGTATLFSKDGDRFVRISTNVMKDNGKRAVGTELNNTTKAYAALSQGVAFYGVVDILGNPYITGYEPLYAKNGDYIGITYMGYKAEMPVLSEALERAHVLQSGFVAVIDDKTVRYLPSWTTKEQVQQRIDNKDGSWVVERTPLPEWGLTIVSAYPVDELHAVSRSVGYGVGLAGLLIGAAISLTLFLLLDRKVLQLLGGEPRLAAEYMKRIADGDLAVDIGVVGRREDSLMSSLKVMQLKLKNLVSAVSGGAAEVNAQSRKFETAYDAFQRGRDDASSQELLRQTKGIGRTLALLEKSIGRFKLSPT
ncbi:MAG TPA: Cache 3/Cache 2 fusion domain-containing protein [Steroidobacteraceae bacterium]|nr:Cache 3/Cache 2 fusion domain-containing protein [Steroidobacteraceae bacterium]